MSVSSWIRRQFKNGVSTTDTVPGGFTSGATSFVAADGSSFPDGSVGPFIITADEGLATEEKVLIQTRSGSTFNIAAGGRGYNGGSAQNHGAGATIFHTIDQQDLDEANQVAVQTLGQIAAGGDLLYGSAAHTLAKLGIGSSGNVLGSSGSAPQWVAPSTLVLSAAQIEALFTLDQQIFSGTGNGTGELIDLMTALKEYSGATILQLTGKSFGGAGDLLVGLGVGTGQVLSNAGNVGEALLAGGAGQVPAWGPAPSHAGTLGSDYTVTGVQSTFMSTSNILGKGTWLITAHFDMSLTSSGQSDIIVVGSGGTLTGPIATSQAAGTEQQTSFSISCIFTASANNATVSFQAVGSGAAQNTIKASSLHTSTAGATGWTATQL